MTDIFNSILASADKDAKEFYAEFKDAVGQADILPIESGSDFHWKLTRKIEQFLVGLVKTEIHSSNDIRFLLLNYQFVEWHFSRLIERVEGGCCCVDKASQITKSLFLFYKDDKEITYKGDLVFKSQNEIITYFEALKSLFFGRPEKYFECFALILKQQK